MLKKCKGFFVIEVLSSFAVFLVLITFLLPIIMKINEEREVIKYKKESLVILHNEKESFLYDSWYAGEKEIVEGARKYHLTINQVGELTKLCVNWEVPWKRKGKVCDYAKK